MDELIAVMTVMFALFCVGMSVALYIHVGLGLWEVCLFFIIWAAAWTGVVVCTRIL
jgi:hypothetical protein